MTPSANNLIHADFPKVACALRSRAGGIVRNWEAAVRVEIARMDRLTLDELRDSFPKMLEAAASAMASADAASIDQMLAAAPVRGLTRFYQQLGLADILHENRLLRAAIVLEVEDELARQMTPVEASVLHATVDAMLRQAVFESTQTAAAQQRDAAERELKYLMFLCHGMNNHLSGVTLSLKLLRAQLRAANLPVETFGFIDLAERAVHETIVGMRQLLDHERLRKAPMPCASESVDLNGILNGLILQFASEAKAMGLPLRLQCPAVAVAQTDAQLVSLTLRNLIGNAVKHANRGTVRIRVKKGTGGSAGWWIISVADEGPGIGSPQIERIAESLRQGQGQGQEGVGLGLAIAAQAARLLKAELTVDSALERGSTFTLRLPP